MSCQLKAPVGNFKINFGSFKCLISSNQSSVEGGWKLYLLKSKCCWSVEEGWKFKCSMLKIKVLLNESSTYIDNTTKNLTNDTYNQGKHKCRKSINHLCRLLTTECTYQEWQSYDWSIDDWPKRVIINLSNLLTYNHRFTRCLWSLSHPYRIC